MSNPIFSPIADLPEHYRVEFKNGSTGVMTLEVIQAIPQLWEPFKEQAMRAQQRQPFQVGAA